jgi:hypothetical protein
MTDFGNVSIGILLGKVLDDVVVGSDYITFVCSDGQKYQLYHSQDCCESVHIEEVIGDWEDLIGNPLTLVEESTNTDNPPEDADSFLWTFYKFATINGYVDVRWLGESNGYYSERVDFGRIK